MFSKLRKIHERVTGEGPVRAIRCNSLIFCCILSLHAWLIVAAQGAETGEPPTRLLARAPFDRLTLNAANDGAVIDVVPLDLPGRRVPEPLPTSGELKLRRIDEPSLEYAVSWNSIARIELYEQLLLTEARQLIDTEKIAEAFDVLSFLHKNYPDLSGLQSMTDLYLWHDSLREFRASRYEDAFVILQALGDRNPNYPGLAKAVDAVGDRLIRSHLKEKKYYAARKVLGLLEQASRGLDLPSVSVWKQKFSQASQRQLKLARSALDRRQYGAARAALRQATEILPDAPGVRSLNARLEREHPEIVVGVSQFGPVRSNLRGASSGPPGGQFPGAFLPESAAPLAGWAALRVAPLVDPPLIERIGFGAEGGVYRCRWASLKADDSGLQFSLLLNPEAFGRGATAAGLARGLLTLADAASPLYVEEYARRLRDISLIEGKSVEIRWKTIPVRPEALVRCNARWIPTLGGSLTYFQRQQAREPEVVRYQRKEARRIGGAGSVQQANATKVGEAEPLVIAERRFRTDDAAVESLVRGEVDLLDRVPPWQLEKLKSHDQVVVGTYRLPTIHVLMFNPRKRLLKEREFRRALCYGIDRAGLVRDILLAGQTIPGFQPVSGPFPAGESRHDPIAYAYNRQLSVRPYEPRLAAVLAAVARVAVAKIAAENKAQADMQRTVESREPEAQGEELNNEETADVKTTELGTDATPVPAASESHGATPAVASGAKPEHDPVQDRPGQVQPQATMPLVLLLPPEPVARAVCQSIKLQLELVGIPIELREVSAGSQVLAADAGSTLKESANADDYDLLYTELAMWEPVVDARRLLGPRGEAGRCSPSMGLALDRLDQAQNWKQAQANLRQVHQIAFYDLPVIPLWQTYNYFAYRKTLDGFGKSPISCYQQVDQWRKVGQDREP